MTTCWLRPPSSRCPDTYGIHAGAQSVGLSRYGAEPFAEIALVGGRIYVEVMRTLVRGFVDMGCVQADARVRTINGPIGWTRQDLRSWLCAADGALGGWS